MNTMASGVCEFMAEIHFNWLMNQPHRTLNLIKVGHVSLPYVNVPKINRSKFIKLCLFK